MRTVAWTLLWILAASPVWAAVHKSDNATCTRLPWPREPGPSPAQLTDMSSVVFHPTYQKFLAIDQDADYHRIWCFNADGTQYGTAGHTAAITCGGHTDHEDMTLVDPYNRNGYQDILVDHVENGEDLCVWSVRDILARCDDGGAITPIHDATPIGAYVTANNSEGLTFYPDPANCPGGLYGGCFLLSSRQWGPYLKRFYLDADFNPHFLDADGFDLAAACGWPGTDTGNDTSEFKYDWLTDYFYFESDSRDAICVTARDFRTQVAYNAEPPGAMLEGFAWGAGGFMYVDDTPTSYDYKSMLLCSDMCRDDGSGPCDALAGPSNLRRTDTRAP